MNAAPLRGRVVSRLWDVADRHDWVTSATLTGSFAEAGSLVGVSDIDLILVVDHLNRERFERLQNEFDGSLRPLLAGAGYDLKINPTLGPLKFNEPRLAVLHLMAYTAAGHVDHVIRSPFTCLDWQRSQTFRKQSLAEVYPVFGLQPRHFFSGRRGVEDYLADFDSGVVSYRELFCDDAGHREVKRAKPMTPRDRHEFAYHAMKFLMLNFLKLVRRPADGGLTRAYFDLFPDGRDEFELLYADLCRRKREGRFDPAVPQLGGRLRAFLEAFRSQFAAEFASRHTMIRHAPTALNAAGSRFQGRVDPDILPRADLGGFGELRPSRVFSSPLRRCRQTLEQLGLDDSVTDDRLAEMDYGAADGLSVADARRRFPATFAAWDRGEDAHFPGGETEAAVAARAESFVAENWAAGGDTLTCTHNVVLRCLVGRALGVPRRDWYRLRVPHGEPVGFVWAPRFGLFAELTEGAERHLFQDFLPAGVTCKS